MKTSFAVHSPCSAHLVQPGVLTSSAARAAAALNEILDVINFIKSFDAVVDGGKRRRRRRVMAREGRAECWRFGWRAAAARAMFLFNPRILKV